jgi:hypothetical protein
MMPSSKLEWDPVEFTGLWFPLPLGCCDGSDGARGEVNFSIKTSLRSELRMIIFSERVKIGAADRSIELIASNSRARQSWDGDEK